MKIRTSIMAALVAAMMIPMAVNANPQNQQGQQQPATINNPVAVADADAVAKAEAEARALALAQQQQTLNNAVNIKIDPKLIANGQATIERGAVETVNNNAATGGEGGNANLTVKEGALSPTAIGVDGNIEGSKAEVGDIDASSNSEGGKSDASAKVDFHVPLPAPGVLSPMVSTPEVPYTQQHGANVRGMQIINILEHLCAQSVEGDGYQYKKGASRTTDIVFMAYVEDALNGPKSKTPPMMTVDESAKLLKPRGPGVKPEEEDLYFRCVGSIQVEGRARRAERANLAVVRGDAQQFVRRYVRGGDNLALFSDSCATSATTGAESRGIGIGVSSGVTGEPGNILATGLAGLTGNRGRTFPRNMIGNTFGILQPASGPGEGVFALSALAKLLYPDPPKPSTVAATATPALVATTTAPPVSGTPQ